MTEQERIDELAALLDGDLGPDDASTGLTGLLTLAEHVRDHAEVTGPTLAFKEHLRAELLATAAPAPSLTERVRDLSDRVRRSTRVAVATATASAMVGGVGVAAAAQEAVPGDLLHPVKTGIESLRLGLADGALTRARLELAFAQERLEELEDGRDLGADVVIASLREMDDRSARGADALLDDATVDQSLLAELATFTRSQRDRLLDLSGRLPVQTRPVVEDSLELLRRIEVRVTAAAPLFAPVTDVLDDLVPSAEKLDPACDCLASSAPGVTGTAATGPLPTVGEQPVDPGCSCVEVPGGPSAREPWRSPDSWGDDLGDALGGDDDLGEGEDDGDLVGDVLDGAGLTTDDESGDAIDDVTDEVDGLTDEVDDTVDGLLDTDVPLQGVTDPLMESVDDLGALLD